MQKLAAGVLIIIAVFSAWIVYTGDVHLSPKEFIAKYFPDKPSEPEPTPDPQPEQVVVSDPATSDMTAHDLYQKGKNLYEGEDYIHALPLLQEGAKKGDAGAQYYMGLMYRNGHAVDKDDTEAVKWYRKASEQGDAAAQNNLGWMLRNGWGVDKDYVEAVKWYRKAAIQGNPRAQTNLGFMLEEGMGIDQNLQEAIKWYKKAAAQGFKNAQDNCDRLKVKY